MKVEDEKLKKIRTIHYGLGPIGQELARLAASRESIEIVGAIDIDPAKIGKDVGEVIGLGRELGIKVRGDAEALFNRDGRGRRSAYHWVVSQAGVVAARRNHQRGLNVVSTCEELSFPAAQFPDLAEKLDEMARANGVTVLGTGVNPGLSWTRWRWHSAGFRSR